MRRGNSASWNNDQATTKTAMIEAKQNPVSIAVEWIQGFAVVESSDNLDIWDYRSYSLAFLNSLPDWRIGLLDISMITERSGGASQKSV